MNWGGGRNGTQRCVREIESETASEIKKRESVSMLRLSHNQCVCVCMRVYINIHPMMVQTHTVHRTHITVCKPKLAYTVLARVLYFLFIFSFTSPYMYNAYSGREGEKGGAQPKPFLRTFCQVPCAFVCACVCVCPVEKHSQVISNPWMLARGIFL